MAIIPGRHFIKLLMIAKTKIWIFPYLCLGIRNDANDSILFERAREWDVKYIEAELFHKEEYFLRD